MSTIVDTQIPTSVETQMLMLSRKEKQNEYEKIYDTFYKKVLKQWEIMTKMQKILLLLQILSSFEHSKACCKGGCKRCCYCYVQSGFPREKHFLEMFIKGIFVPFNHEWFNHNVIKKQMQDIYILNSVMAHMSNSKLSIEKLRELNDEYEDKRVFCQECKNLYSLVRFFEKLHDEQEKKDKQEEKEDDVFPPVVKENLQEQQQSLEQEIEEYFKQRFGDECMKKILTLLSFTSIQDIMVYLTREFDKLKISRFGSSVKFSYFKIPLGFDSDIDLASPNPNEDNIRIIELLHKLGFNIHSNNTQCKYGLMNVFRISYSHPIYEYIRGTIDLIDIKFLNKYDVAPEQSISFTYSNSGTLSIYYGNLCVLCENKDVFVQMEILKQNILGKKVTLYRWDNLSDLILRVIWAKFMYIQKLLNNDYDIIGLGFCGMPFVPNMTQKIFTEEVCKTITDILRPLYIRSGRSRIFPRELANILIELIGPDTFSDESNQCHFHYQKCKYLFIEPCCNRKNCLNKMDRWDDRMGKSYGNYKCNACLKKP